LSEHLEFKTRRSDALAIDLQLDAMMARMMFARGEVADELAFGQLQSLV
jgi:hypothetical protein